MLDSHTHVVQRTSRAPRRTFRSRMAAAAAVGLVAGTLAACSPLGDGSDPNTERPEFLRGAIVNTAKVQIYSAKGTATLTAPEADTSATLDFVAVSDLQRIEMDATLRKATIYGKDFTFEARFILNAATNLSDTFVEVPKARELVNYVVDWAKDIKEADFMPTLDELDPAIVLLEKNAISMVTDEDRISEPREQEWITACRDELNGLYRDPERMGQAYDDLVSKKMITVRATDAKEVGGERSQGFALRFAEVSKYEFRKRMRNTSLEPVIDACSKDYEIIEDSAPLQDEPREVATSPDDASDGESEVGAPSPDFTYSQSGRVELYVGVESGQLTGATFESETDSEKTTVSVEFGRDQVEVKKPSPSISLEDLISSATDR